MLFINSKLLKQFGRKIAPGKIVFQEGQEGKTMYVIYSGKIEISKNIQGEQKVLAVLSDNDFFGEMALLNNEPRSATAKALVSTEILEIDQLGFESLVKKTPEISLRLVAGLTTRLKEMNLKLDVLFPVDPIERLNKHILYLADKFILSTQKSPNFPGPFRLRVVPGEVSLATNLPEIFVEKMLLLMEKAQIIKREKETIVIENKIVFQSFHKYLLLRRKELGLEAA